MIYQALYTPNHHLLKQGDIYILADSIECLISNVDNPDYYPAIEDRDIWALIPRENYIIRLEQIDTDIFKTTGPEREIRPGNTIYGIFGIIPDRDPSVTEHDISLYYEGIIARPELTVRMIEEAILRRYPHISLTDLPRHGQTVVRLPQSHMPWFDKDDDTRTYD